MLIIENRVIFYYFEGAYEFFYNALRKSSNDTINTFMVAVEGNTIYKFRREWKGFLGLQKRKQLE